jgi:hypothetical protein
MAFFDKVQDELNHSNKNKILTENGAIAYASAGSSLVDFNYGVSNLRNKTPEQIMALFERCYIDNPVLATKLMFQIGDVREGKGERRTFNTCLRYMAAAHPEIAKALLPLVPEYTRWDHVAEMVTCGEPSVQRFARKMIAEQMRKDYNTALLIERDSEGADEQQKAPRRSLSLCAKWTPALGSTRRDHHKIALKICDELGISKKEYRQMRSTILRHLNVLEIAASAKQLDGVNFEHMTAGQQAKYKETLKENAGEAYQEYLDKVEAGEAVMHADPLTPAPMVHMYSVEQNPGRTWLDTHQVKPYDQATELLWNNLKQIDVAEGKSCIVVRDDSGSMLRVCNDKTTMSCFEVATALSLYCAERLPAEFKDKFISFSHTPKYMDTSPFHNLHDKLQYCYSHSEVANTDIQATFDLLLNTAIHHNMKQEEIPSTVLIISDMEFDGATCGNDKALFENIREQWKSAGYEMPVLAFWNVNAVRSVVPSVDDRGVILLSGFNVDNLDLVMNGGLAEYTPLKQLEITLSKERYDAVEKAFAQGLEAEHKNSPKNVSFAEFLPDEGYSKIEEQQSEDLDQDDESWDW